MPFPDPWFLTKLVPGNSLFHTMRNRLFYGTESDLITCVIRALGKRLPPTWSLAELGRQEGWGKDRPDAVVRLQSPEGKTTDIVLAVKRIIDPKDVPTVIAQARRLARGRVIWVAAPFLSPGTRERLKQEGVSYADATGNMWFTLDNPAIFLETVGEEKNPLRTSRPLGSLKGRAAGRVVRALCDFEPPYGIRELAERSKTPLGSVARVVALLDREAIVIRLPRGAITNINLESLIRRWTQDYSLLGSNLVETYLEPRGIPTLIGKLADLKAKYAVTGSLAAACWAPVAIPRLAVLYVTEPLAVAERLGLKSTEMGANVMLARPFDPVVYERGSTIDRVYYASPSQVAADLLTSPGRSPIEGEELIRWMKENSGAWKT